MMNLLPFHFLYFEVGAFVIDLILMAILTGCTAQGSVCTA